MNEQVVLVTGAAGRIGSAFTEAIVKNGGKVILVDIDEAKGRILESELGLDRAFFSKADVTIPKETDNSIQAGMKHFGSFDAAVHCAYPFSEGWGTRFEDLKPDYLAQDLHRQLGGAILFSQRIICHFHKQGHGNLIHVASIQGIAAPKFEHYEETDIISPIEYTAIKAGVISITRYLAKYCKGSNIRVNCISPGGILSGQPQPFLEKYKQDCISKGMLDPEDIKGALLFLLSDKSKYITGQNIIVDDGWTL